MVSFSKGRSGLPAFYFVLQIILYFCKAMSNEGKKIHRFFKRNCYENLLFGWVTSIRYFLPGVTIPKAIDQFFKYYEIDENEFSKNNAKVIINRMTKEYFDNEKTKGELINNQ